MTALKDKLKNTLTIAKQAGLEDNHFNFDIEDIKKDREYLQDTMKNITQKFTDQIESDKIPHHILDDEMTEWIFEGEKHIDIYDDFAKYWKSQGLSAVVKKDLEGNDVLTLTILPDTFRGT